MSLFELFLWSFVVLALVATVLISLYGIAKRPNLVKKLIALTILGDTANLFVILFGYRLIYPVAPPVLAQWNESGVKELLRKAVDPLPQALVITAIVIGMAVNIFIAFLIIQAHRLYRSVDTREIAKYGGE